MVDREMKLRQALNQLNYVQRRGTCGNSSNNHVTTRMDTRKFECQLVRADGMMMMNNIICGRNCLILICFDRLRGGLAHRTYYEIVDCPLFVWRGENSLHAVS